MLIFVSHLILQLTTTYIQNIMMNYNPNTVFLQKKLLLLVLYIVMIDTYCFCAIKSLNHAVPDATLIVINSKIKWLTKISITPQQPAQFDSFSC